jgi:CRISPR/Cas system-associated protein Cas10 (large subunit of type III CRISPR-Cas system)
MDNPDHSIARRMARYGVTPEWYRDKSLEQDYSCAVCLTKFEELNRNPCIDHNHSTSEVRGLLCHRCNIFIGMIEANLMPLALQYLEKYNG